METLNVQQFKALKQKTDCLLIDVREEYEYEDENIGGLNIPLAEVLCNLDKINRSKSVVFLCRSGKRSMAIAQTVERKTSHSGICTLSGGLDAYLEKEPWPKAE